MTTLRTRTAPNELELAGSLFARMAADLSMIVDRGLAVDDIRVERRTQRPAGRDLVHISFKLSIQHHDETWPGCLLVPLPDAIALAAYMMMMPDGVAARERNRTELDTLFKEALLEVGKFLAGACDAVLRVSFSEACVTRSDGCQGVRADVRPALSCREDQPLFVARARARVHDFEPFELILVLPCLDELAAESPSA
ncbi:MAG: hypothetical protein HOP15_00230 [Planctomycetes bacterium]|nr:hypothetical protein [Planctomycetota bacterium]